ncbi:hypothetical protein E4U43_008211 [Claviceps pusilla]|uniref:Uncharacterized protein n=1 Tax=Claviceps pusilla TaxID=123648 RepID=A0A9P7NBH3_9HYPO|nr:hypothetical protein E4U43_008211 [Claviceps pusilla]
MLPVYISILASALGLASAQLQPCGFKIAPCPDDQICVPDSPRCSNLDRCPGTCQYVPCGGFRATPVTCPPGTECRDDPRTPRGCGLACDAPGICISLNAPPCAGFAGLACPAGYHCYDVPYDGCDPLKGGADCLGICLRGP